MSGVLVLVSIGIVLTLGALVFVMVNGRQQRDDAGCSINEEASSSRSDATADSGVEKTPAKVSDVDEDDLTNDDEPRYKRISRKTRLGFDRKDDDFMGIPFDI